MFIIKEIINGVQYQGHGQIKDSHLTHCQFHNQCARSMCGFFLAHWHDRMYKVQCPARKTEFTSNRQAFYNRQLQFLHRVPCMEPPGQTNSHFQAARLGPEVRMTAGTKANKLSTWKNSPEKETKKEVVDVVNGYQN